MGEVAVPKVWPSDQAAEDRSGTDVVLAPPAPPDECPRAEEADNRRSGPGSVSPANPGIVAGGAGVAGEAAAQDIAARPPTPGPGGGGPALRPPANPGHGEQFLPFRRQVDLSQRDVTGVSGV